MAYFVSILDDRETERIFEDYRDAKRYAVEKSAEIHAPIGVWRGDELEVIVCEGDIYVPENGVINSLGIQFWDNKEDTVYDAVAPEERTKQQQRIALDCESKLMLAEYMLKWAQSLIDRATEIMSPEQVGEWAGVRAWRESVPDNDDEYRLLAELLDGEDGWAAFVAYKNARPVYLRIRRNLTPRAADAPSERR